MGVLIFIAGAMAGAGLGVMAGAGLGVMAMAVLQIARDASGLNDDYIEVAECTHKWESSIGGAYCYDCYGVWINDELPPAPTKRYVRV